MYRGAGYDDVARDLDTAALAVPGSEYTGAVRGTGTFDATVPSAVRHYLEAQSR